MAGENKKRFNIIDAVLVLAILAIFAGVFMRSGFKDKFSQRFEKGEIEYTFVINSIRESSEKCFQNGKKIYSQATQKEIGQITSFEVRPAQAYVEMDNGEILKSTISGRIDVIVTARVAGSIDSDGRCMMDGTTHIAPGKEIYAHLDNISFMCTVEKATYIPSQNP